MSTPAGWYPDPSNAPQTRYWEGGHWTSDTRPFVPPLTRQDAPKKPVKKRGNGWIYAGAVIAGFGILMGFLAAATTHVDSYGNSVQGGPTVGTFLVIILGIILAATGFCIRLLGAVEKR
ncbi:hypothetical protein AHiyo8_49110 [Arthrobacter sp. Hiyo8]|uniref:DUF2510 domain-containing protein n=1 Tax=Arthrobacter sp. Hiyo1 TaxID=1588020 RepID=UPI00068399C6|nr:DUF2510 domain-containing protein [Arthrobacter sp. Hiyo1]BAS16608.1 hypothetical protein AHiyo8_49110 [Arthrobacter sp. Hiyo8]GAP57334.1 hypothetical protein AHiyo1_01660 [Arthrobacter sp. Hiyo1]